MTRTYEVEDEPSGVNKVGDKQEKSVLYGVEDVPAVHLCFLFGLQVTFYLLMRPSKNKQVLLVTK